VCACAYTGTRMCLSSVCTRAHLITWKLGAHGLVKVETFFQYTLKVEVTYSRYTAAIKGIFESCYERWLSPEPAKATKTTSKRSSPEVRRKGTAEFICLFSGIQVVRGVRLFFRYIARVWGVIFCYTTRVWGVVFSWVAPLAHTPRSAST